MGMFDWYRPKIPLNCPVCKLALAEWQGKNGPCLLFVWRQGFAAPVNHLGDGEDFQFSDENLKSWRLSDEFEIYSSDCKCSYPVTALCRTENDVWITTELVTKENAVQSKFERKTEYSARLKWLKSAK